MKYEAAVLAVAGLAAARELSLYKTVAKREVPQEHSHAAIVRTVQKALVLDNPQEIVDAVFGLLGTQAAAAGKGKVTNPDCLQQIVADQAFTNAKKVGDLDGQANAILYRALERNTAGVGKESAACKETAKNPEIAAIKQHQDPASPAASGNKQIALDVAKQLKAIGADPNLAINTGTFHPGDPKDVTFKGKSCNDEKDEAGCIFTLKLLVPDVTKEEIAAAVGGKKNARAGGKNVQTFTGALGGAAAPPVLQDDTSNRPFSVDGDTFLKAAAALGRSCAIQHNKCADAANKGGQNFTASDCGTQEKACQAASKGA